MLSASEASLRGPTRDLSSSAQRDRMNVAGRRLTYLPVHISWLVAGSWSLYRSTLQPMFRRPPPPPTAELSLNTASTQRPGGSAPDDLGLSGVFEGESRMVNRNGTFNSRRVGLGISAYNPYTLLLSMSWAKFFTVSLGLYLLLNGLFALLFYFIGPKGLSEMPAAPWPRLLAAFFFSVQTFGTIGFGHVFPVTLAANVVVTLEAFVGLLAVALLTGMLFARFSRPTHRILFSQQAVIAPYKGGLDKAGLGLMFRLVNGRRGDLMDAAAEVVLSLHRPGYNAAQRDASQREFHTLNLERSRVTFIPLAWTVVHPITPDSPLHGLTPADLHAREAELIVILRAVDETSQQAIQARTSYHAREILWGRKFASMYVRNSGLLAVDAKLLNDTQEAELPPFET